MAHIEPLPEYAGESITVEQLMVEINRAERQGCADENGKPVLTLLDFRTENFLKTDKPISSIRTQCRTIKCLLDDLRNPEVRSQIPREGLVVLVCETGNRDKIALRYLAKYGHTNAVGLRFGMRAWIKAGYPSDTEN
jgi:rhodanese-related sulfurtransferase